MAKTTLIQGDSANLAERLRAQLIFTDPPFDMATEKLCDILNYHDSEHLLLIATMRQIMAVERLTKYVMSFDGILQISPKKSKSIHQPHYNHVNYVYFKKPRAKSIFNRKKHSRHDAYNTNYWPTVIDAPTPNSEIAYQKNQSAIKSLLGSFDTENVLDLFCGSGSTILAASELGVSCTGVEINQVNIEYIKSALDFLDISYDFKKEVIL